MADTLTIKQDDQSTDVENLTTEEQDSLQVGEEMAKEQGELLAGKYKNAEDLEKAYVELQKKLGDKEEPEATKDEEEVTDTKDEPEEKGEAYSLIESASDEYYQNGESLSPETLEKFKGMSSQDLVEGYMQMVKDNPQTNQPEIDVTTAEINKIQNSVGGETQYNNLVSWAGQNLPENEIKAFDDLVGTGNAAAIQLGVDALKSRYEAVNGYEGRRLTGKAADTSGDVFRSQAQLVEAMSDPRYDRDPAYRQDVVAKLERSDIDF
ncbi:head assembly [Prochlorococcus phage P-SSP3]|uniref:Capsid assembly protein n=2 Tax=Tritonvirus TaxID=2731985 RepID=M1TW10_9CAUD|nr:head assembly [Cyanophage P-SSP2]YP_007677166.1 head assembly [Prochlorococcus phage P-SSP3]ADP00243.1 capsid assembly protein [Cyanophage P-SSP2]AGG54584.1 capsid assembly protein [Prochlorococcus phage P-SSP3]